MRRGPDESDFLTTPTILMDTSAERLDKKLREWSPEVAEEVRRQVDELIELADRGLLDIARSRSLEQDVLDLLDEPSPR
ncbi:hypothetical protein ElP_68960 [Tautonia plasticadhaerens]|uniref:Uncharacterized protein n=2 Tax=Tautonia plasticadhaerens TaxID=2527974 RepID=A0A518HE00_9BACT|nr:hypothetical protein ElP_68960 [Tautonia plasticadhaerens]